MRIFLSLIILFALAIGLAIGARYNAGNVVLFYPPYRVDLSLNLFILLVALLFMVLMTVLGTIRATTRIPSRVAAYRRNRREREGNKALREALKALFEGRFGQAEKSAARASRIDDNVPVAALLGARAAHGMGKPERRDAWLARIAGDQNYRTARLLTAIELAIDAHETESALDSVRELNIVGTRHIHALRLALKANQRGGNWTEVLRLVRLLEKRKALHPALSQRLRELAYGDLLGGQAQDRESLRRLWDEIPSQERLQPQMALLGIRAFGEQGLQDDARKIAEQALGAEWDGRLVRAYARYAAPEGSPELLSQIERCEGWLQRHPQDSELELALGTLCLRQKLWGKAQRHLESALARTTDTDIKRDAHLQLAQLHEGLNQPEIATSHYRQSALAGSV